MIGARGDLELIAGSTYTVNVFDFALLDIRVAIVVV